jgi:hypothetical protein
LLALLAETGADLSRRRLLSVIFVSLAFPHFLDDFLKTLHFGDSFHAEPLEIRQ